MCHRLFHANIHKIKQVAQRSDSETLAFHPAASLPNSATKRGGGYAQRTRKQWLAVGGKTCGNLRCSKEPSYDFARSEKERFCGEPAADGMVGDKNKLCAYSGCLQHRSYGAAGAEWSEVCAEHVGDVVVHISCKEELEEGYSKQPEFGVPGDITADGYSVHASDGMMDAISRRCAGKNCLKGPVFGFKGGTKGIFCAEHAVDGMICIAKRTFAHEGSVRKRPFSGIADARNMKVGAGDAPGGLGNIADVSWRCAAEGSSIGPNYSASGCWKGEGFAIHTPGGMMAVAKVPCAHEGYVKHANYSVARSRRREFCASPADM